MAEEAAVQPTRPGHPLTVALRLLNADAPIQITGTPQAWPRWALLLPHVLAATAHIDNATDQHDPPATAEAAQLLDRAGTYLQVHARLTDARALLERALAIDEATYGPDHPNVATRLNNLATILQDLGQSAAARPLQERALAIYEATYGPDHPNVGTGLSVLAMILQALGQQEAARPLLERALTITEAAYGPDHPAVATALNNSPRSCGHWNSRKRPGRYWNGHWPSTRLPTGPTTPTSPPT